MTDIERDAMLRELHQAIKGIPGTDDKGMLGDMKEIKTTVKDVCEDQNKLKGKVNNLIWFMAGSGVLAGGTIIKMIVG